MIGGGGGGGGREGDWDCSGCGNRNYAFRCFCNRCKQPRLLVDNKTPADSKWLPRIGDWICTGCTNNNYASRDKCKKCGQPKEIAAMPATAIPGASFPTYPNYPNYFARAQGVLEQTMNVGLLGNGAPTPSLPLSSNWSLAGTDKFGFQPSSSWPVGGTNGSGMLHASQTSQLVAAPKGWRSGDWICSCGFHNYSSRAQCKKCNASVPPAPTSSFVSTEITALGTKRLASEELVQGWDNKRLNAGLQAYPGTESTGMSSSNQPNIISSNFLDGISAVASNLQPNLQAPPISVAPTLLGKGAKQWRQGDWMCTNCNNHNYASRSQCNRCKTQRKVLSHPVGVV